MWHWRDLKIRSCQKPDRKGRQYITEETTECARCSLKANSLPASQAKRLPSRTPRPKKPSTKFHAGALRMWKQQRVLPIQLRMIGALLRESKNVSGCTWWRGTFVSTAKHSRAC